MSVKLIIALDYEKQQDAFTLLEHVAPDSCALKIGSEMFTLFGAKFVRQLVAKDYKVFLDLKFHDIPNTVAKACKASAELGVWMLNVHATGGMAMMTAARQALADFGDQRPLLIAVTVLTSMNAEELTTLGVKRSLPEQVAELATMAKNAGLDGVVCSAQEAALIKLVCGNQFITVTPGIRLDQSENDDQTRIMTPEQAVKAGSDFLVIGRPITRAANPAAVISQILSTLNP